MSPKKLGHNLKRQLIKFPVLQNEKQNGKPILPAKENSRGNSMTQLALAIDLDVCVGCQACVTSCKQ